jgi:hypothetical protein
MTGHEDQSRAGTRRIHAALRKQGTSLHAWSLAHGYRPGTVTAVVSRWGWRPDQIPHGGIARQVMADLNATIGADIRRRNRRAPRSTTKANLG